MAPSWFTITTITRHLRCYTIVIWAGFVDEASNSFMHRNLERLAVLLQGFIQTYEDATNLPTWEKAIMWPTFTSM